MTEISNANWADITTTAATAATIIGFVTYWFYRKEHQLHGLVEAFKLLNDSEHRQTRKNVYAISNVYNNCHQIKVFSQDTNKKYVEMVRADFDQMGTLVRYDTIQKKGFLELYGETAYRCRIALKDHIKEERITRNFDYYMENFKWLADEEYRYW